ncbi:MAG: 50S ribosomal protein L23 [Defluviitaleaceae bacterium]|nr:50S ribosomal protein L23 [Defluviitaleaceae bacterium]
MANLQYYDILLKPLMTEKSMFIVEQGIDDDKMKRLEKGKDPRTHKSVDPVYSFYVHPDATKTQIKEAVERLFSNVKVASVNTMTVQPKKRHRRGSKPGKTARRKKALVKLTPDSSPIEYFEGI